MTDLKMLMKLMCESGDACLKGIFMGEGGDACLKGIYGRSHGYCSGKAVPLYNSPGDEALLDV